MNTTFNFLLFYTRILWHFLLLFKTIFQTNNGTVFKPICCLMKLKVYRFFWEHFLEFDLLLVWGNRKEVHRLFEEVECPDFKDSKMTYKIEPLNNFFVLQDHYKIQSTIKNYESRIATRKLTFTFLRVFYVSFLKTARLV